jgi:hypothetical protein
MSGWRDRIRFRENSLVYLPGERTSGIPPLAQGSGEEEARADENRLSLTKKICAAPVGTET